MGDHFVLLVDRLLTESTLEAAIESRNQILEVTKSASKALLRDISSHRIDMDIDAPPMKLVQCRICHDEDEDSNMEIPCSCCGTLKYAHRDCVQRWCNEKGDTTCEICQQPFMPDYTAPPPLFHYGGIPMNFRGNWEISRRDGHDPRFIAMFMVLLVLRHTLPILVSGAGEYSITLFTLLMLRTIGILLPVYFMVRAFAAVQRRRHQQDPRNFSLDASDEDSELHEPPQQPHIIHIR